MTRTEIEAALLKEVDAATDIYAVDAAIHAWLYRTNVEERKNRMKVLYFEDEPSIAKMTSAVLGRRGIEVKHFATLAEGKKEISWCDVILCDGTFPSEPGKPPARTYTEVLRIAEHHEKPVVLFSGDDQINEYARKNQIAFLRKGSVRNEEIIQALMAQL